MPADSSFHDLMARLQAGDQDAARDCFQRYAHRLIGLARSRMNPRLRQKVDAEDVVQSVFNSFFARQADGQFDLQNWDSLWSMLVVITLRKCGRRVEYFRAARRDISREADLRARDDSGTDWEAIASDPSPSEALVLAETLEGIFDQLDDEGKQVVSMRLQGYSVIEISEKIGRTERTVHRVLERVRRRMLELQET